MHNPQIWRELGVPLLWEELPTYKNIMPILEARDNKEIELMIDFDHKIWWRRDLTEHRELGL